MKPNWKTESKMSFPKTPQPFLRAVPLTVLLIGSLGFCGFCERRNPVLTAAMPHQAPLVRTETIVAAEAPLALAVDGEVRTYREISVASEVAGRIQWKSDNCRAGAYVSQGDLLFTVDPGDYKLEVRRIQQAVAQASVSVEELDVQQSNNAALMEIAKSDAQVQQRDVARIQSLLGKRAVSQSDLDKVRRDALQVRKTLQSLANQKRLLETRRGRLLREKDRLETELDKAILALNRTEVRSPINGLVMEDLFEQDDFVQRGATVVRLEDTSRVDVRFNLRLKELRWVWSRLSDSTSVGGMAARRSYQLPPLPVKIQLDVQGQVFQWDAVLSRFDGAGIDSATRTVACVATVDNPRQGRAADMTVNSPLPLPPALLRGMFVRVEIQVSCSFEMLQVPSEALRPGNRLWLYEKGRLAVQQVHVARKLQDRILLFTEQSHVSAGDHVIVSPLGLATDGMQVRSDSSSSHRSDHDPYGAMHLALNDLAMQK
jgi:multidrug efflux pump subunit AcrA (membrane-fusion protein)